MPHDAYKALYLHIPFCKSRCAYCDFTTKAIRSDSKEITHYVEWVISEIRRLSREGELASIETVYFGGGTPTHIGSKHLTSLLYALSTSMHLTPEVECSIEANPESLDERLVADLWALGANRISLGVQSFDDDLLARAGRIHTGQEALRAIEAAQTRFENVSVDLICGLPGQTLDQFDHDLTRALEAGVTHVSIYPLTIERGTKFARLLDRGRLELPSDDVVADMMELAEERLEGGGLYRYEVASYAKAGFECRHNIAYWTAKPYLGIGDSAVTMTQNDLRRMRVQDGAVIDDLNPQEMAAEDLMLAMRMTRGIEEARLDHLRKELPGLDAQMASLADKGLVISAGGTWRPTERGWLLGNELYEAILDLADNSGDN